MPIIGTEFVNTKPVLLKFLGFSKSNNVYVLGTCYGNHTFIIKVNIFNWKINQQMSNYIFNLHSF